MPLRIEAGGIAEELAAFLGRPDPYHVELDVWRLVDGDLPDLLQDTLGQGAVLGPFPTPCNRACGGPPGNLKGLKHGLYASHLPAEDFEGVDELPRESQEEVTVLRVAIGRTLTWLGKPQTFDESCRFLEVLGKTAGHLGNLMKTQHELCGGKGGAVQAVEEALARRR